MRIVIVGAVAGGMSAAARARRLAEDAEIVVLERGPYVSFANCGLPYFVGGEIADVDDLLLRTPQSLAATLDLDVRPHHDVIGLDAQAHTVTVQTPDGVETIGYDALVLAPGAKALRPDLPGLDSPRVTTLRTVDDAIALRAAASSSASRAVVLGGGFIGLEAAEALHARGLETTVVEMAPHVLPPLDTDMAGYITSELARLGIAVRSGVAATQIHHSDSHDTVTLSDGSSVDADIIVLSVGVRPDTATFAGAGVACERGAIVVDEHGRTNLADVWAVGDATVSTDAITGIRRPVALAGPANRAGRLVADAIVQPTAARPIPQPVGTAIVRIGELTAAMTGASRATLTREGVDAHTVHLHASQHAGYFPGAEAIHLAVSFAPDGRLLGAQAVGRDGVDKRIDVLSTALRAGMSAPDLIDLDLAYAPPYGAAKDPITMAGLMADNVLSGLLRLWYAEEVDEVLASALVVDVRSAAEFASGHLPGAVHIPHTEIREQLDTIRRLADGRPVRLVCASGFRSYLAHRVLAHAGFDSAMLSGGTTTLRATLGPRATELLVAG